MTNPKYHWAIQIDDTFRHRNAWKGYAGGRFVQACGRKYSGASHAESAAEFMARSGKDPDWFCVTCATKARLALAAESAPNPDAVVWPKPRPISEAPKDGSMVLICVPGCDPMWTIGVFDARQRWIDQCLAGASVNPTHFLPLPPSPEVK